MERKYTAQEWLAFVGKDKLQTVQDLFSKCHGVSMAFFDTDRNGITVWSQESLFCWEIQKENLSRCQEAGKDIVTAALADGALKFFTCPFGIMGFVCPVHFQGEVVAYAYCNGVTEPESKIRTELRQRYHLTTMNKEMFTEIGELFSGILALMDVNLNIVVTKNMDNAKQRNKLPDERISEREREIAEFVCKGYTNKQIADALYISETTVKSHVSSILTKLNLRDRMQIIVHYYDKDKNK